MRFKWVAFVEQKRRSCTMRHVLNTMMCLICMADTREKKTCLLFPAAKVNTPKAATTTNACNHPNHPSKTSCHTSCHLQLKKLHTKLHRKQTNNGLENATRACKSVSLQLFVENKMPQRDCMLTELALSPCYL